MQDLRQDLSSVGDLVSTLEDNEMAREREMLRQEIICHQEQKDNLRDQAEDLENRTAAGTCDLFEHVSVKGFVSRVSKKEKEIEYR
ncbi:hypothetical protein NDU88_002192 [Pleurodeles waltl]|uniref:Uncharacterized protein n=1 Tax=Pleurodeles waltl TaxID=8319 RepID=A0AAV7Q8M2_PLEWA|nr:hypothetical protein NDU88_002192 [Pleurodeles waltl]